MRDVDEKPSEVTGERRPFRILTLDGGGAKGFYTLGVLAEIEAMLSQPLHSSFDLIYGTSTGAIISTLLALGYSVEEIHDLYKEHVPKVMSNVRRAAKTAALKGLAREVFGERTFLDVRTRLGIVAAKWQSERPMIFKSHPSLAHGMQGTFVPGFGVPLADAVQASCSAYPFFDRTTVTTSTGDRVELIDGGYCANNPTLYAIADVAGRWPPEEIRVVSIGVGEYPMPRKLHVWLVKKVPFNAIDLLQKTLAINTQSMDQLRHVLFQHVPTIRISDAFTSPEMATDLLESDLRKLNILRQRGRESFANRESQLKAFLM